MDRLENELKSELLKGDLAYPRGFLTNTVLWESDNNSDIEKLVRIAEVNGVFENLKGSINRKSKTYWNEDYQDSIQTELMLNYSKERFLYFLEVANYLSTKENESKINSRQEVKTNHQPAKAYNSSSNLVAVKKVKVNDIKKSGAVPGKKKQAQLAWVMIVSILLLIIVVTKVL